MTQNPARVVASTVTHTNMKQWDLQIILKLSLAHKFTEHRFQIIAQLRNKWNFCHPVFGNPDQLELDLSNLLFKIDISQFQIWALSYYCLSILFAELRLSLAQPPSHKTSKNQQ